MNKNRTHFRRCVKFTILGQSRGGEIVHFARFGLVQPPLLNSSDHTGAEDAEPANSKCAASDVNLQEAEPIDHSAMLAMPVCFSTCDIFC